MAKNRDWMYNAPRVSVEYINNVNNFLERAFANGAIGDEICCPCHICCNYFWYSRDLVYDHLIVKGFVENYYDWFFHGEGVSSRMDVDKNIEKADDVADDAQDNLDRLLHDVFRDLAQESLVNQEDGLSDHEERLTKEAKKFYKLVDEDKQQLFLGCKTFSKLSFIIQLYLHKCIHDLSNEAFDDYLAIWREAIPEINLPKSYYEAKRIVTDLGLDYKKIHVCPNDCMLYHGEDGENVACSKYGESRWKTNKQGVPVKVLRYFSLEPRVQRLFMCSQTAESISWHAKERLQDGNLRHPADDKAWKNFDSNHPDFAQDPRNVRLGLASDKFNPFRTMSISHSTWSVILINYNLPPWMSIKPEYFMLSLIILGPQSPGNNIDVYLQPLIDT